MIEIEVWFNYNKDVRVGLSLNGGAYDKVLTKAEATKLRDDLSAALREAEEPETLRSAESGV